MSKPESLTYEEWEEVGEQVKRVDEELTELVTILNDIPKTVWHDGHAQATAGMCTMKDQLEQRLVKEHPDKWDTDVFYGGAGEE
jgi:hypothetical protein